MKKVMVTVSIDREAKENLQKRAKANGMTLSGYINVLGHASEIYHKLKVKEDTT